MKAFLSPVPVNVGPNVESRGHDSALGAVPIHCCSVHISKARCPVWKNCTRTVTFQNMTVHTIVVVVDDLPILTQHIQANEKRS